ncbi:hypothetical protein TSAR_002030 [Trichomalopsis sarcophagae]|uniref:Coenzyme Q-binding protein COQ10 START domain-containing protein n=1 Tax=Trichomalopsis sarcophagae TaxID=543379 RepID=A0A232FME1_9HYME|nr:hypothetical protein TSAR_002030 [Trichomalopsis sarcophagae]
MVSKFVVLLLLPFVSIAVHKLYQLEVDPTDFVCHHQKQIKGDPGSLFEFITTPLALEKLLPWLTRFKEADKRIVAPGKSYRAVVEVPILGERLVRALLTDYKPSKLFALDFSNDLLKQRIVIQTRGYHDRAFLQTTIYFRRTSLIYQYTIGYALRVIMKNQLEESMKNVATLFENVGGPDKIPNFSTNNA